MIRRLLGRVLLRQDGSTMVVAIGTMAAISVLLAATAATSTQLSTTSENDRSVKRALATAEGGLRQALYRVNNLAPADANCTGNGGGTIGTLDAANGVCTASGDLGNGASYTYHVSTVPYSQTCAGLPSSADSNVTVRCVTAEATVNGVTRRVQGRIARFMGLPLFPVGGILAKDAVLLKNNSTIRGQLGSNGQITVDNNTTIRDGVALGPNAPNVNGANKISGNVSPLITRRTPAQGDWVLSPLEFGSSATVNNNGAWSGSNHTYTAGSGSPPNQRHLHLDKHSITLNGGPGGTTGIYNLCKLTTNSNVTINIPVGARVMLLIDSPTRAGSGCPAGSGYIEAENHVTVNNPNSADAFQIHVYGPDPAGRPAVEFNNTFTMNKGVLSAPRGKVVFKNSAEITGALAVNQLEAHNNLDFTSPEGGVDVRANTSPVYSQTYWHECRSRPSGAGPMAGC